MLFDAGFALGLVVGHGFSDRADILFDRHFTKNRCLLRQVTNPEASTPIHRKIRQVIVVEKDFTLCRRHEANYHVKGGRFTCTVRP